MSRNPDEDRSGRPPLLAEQTEGLLPRLMGRSPQDLGDPHTDWTVPLLQQMNLTTGMRLWLPRPQGRSGDFQAFLGLVRQRYRGRHVALLLDGDSSHTAKASLRAAEGMTLPWLPKRSPELNPQGSFLAGRSRAKGAEPELAATRRRTGRSSSALAACEKSSRNSQVHEFSEARSRLREP